MLRTKPIHRKHVELIDSFWSERSALIRNEVIPYQWRVLNDEEPSAVPSHTIRNFKIAAGETSGEYVGMVFQDSDLAKWLEAVGYSLHKNPNPELEKLADSVVDLIGKAQEPDGYLDTYFIVTKPQDKWTNLRDLHELYCAGHLIEGAAAYYEATGKKKIIDIVSKLVDHIGSVLGPEKGKKQGYPGHEEIELALVKLYRITGDERHLALSKYFVDERGQTPRFFGQEADARNDLRPYNFAYSQSHTPVRDQTTAEGHAVRAMYLYSAMADLAAEYQDEGLLKACQTLWSNVTNKRMYITGGIGSSQYEESFTVDYDLPNDRAYTETCAAIGLVFWAHRMLQLDVDGKYADVIERALYNGILSGMSMDGKKYFYVNPLEVLPVVTNHRHDMSTVKTERQAWFGCACCPPNIARLVASIEQYLYSRDDDTLYIHTYTGSRVQFDVRNQSIMMVQRTEYPWDGLIDITVFPEESCEFTMGLRIPSWCRKATICVNDEEIDIVPLTERGYARIRRCWSEGDRLVLQLLMTVERVQASPNVRQNVGKIALQRGPVIFCLEEVDNGTNLGALVLPSDASIEVSRITESPLDGLPCLKAQGYRESPTSEEEKEEWLYRPVKRTFNAVELKAVPYFSWCNREPGEMLVWIREH